MNGLNCHFPCKSGANILLHRPKLEAEAFYFKSLTTEFPHQFQVSREGAAKKIFLPTEQIFSSNLVGNNFGGGVARSVWVHTSSWKTRPSSFYWLSYATKKERTN